MKTFYLFEHVLSTGLIDLIYCA